MYLLKRISMFSVKTRILCGMLGLGVLCLAACHGDELVFPIEYELLPGETPDLSANPSGMYLLNEGNMGSNKASLDYVDFRNGLYLRNLYPERNPTVVKELGDVGNDLQIYGSKLYAVLNCSHKVEVMEAASGRRIGQIDIPNCRYIRFHQGMAYVSSYVGGAATGSNVPKGAVYKVDTAALSIVGQVGVGYQPEEMEVLGNYLYVANSGGYRAEYDSTLSVVDLTTFRQVEKIPVAINLHRVKKDAYNCLWVTSRGDYGAISGALFVLTRKAGTHKMTVTDTLHIPCSGVALAGDSLFFYAAGQGTMGSAQKQIYGIIDIPTRRLVSEQFITDGSEQQITRPYGIAVHPVSGDVFLTDAKNYVSSGKLYCYTRHGTLKWSVRTGDIPSNLAFWAPEKQTNRTKE